MAVCGWNHLNFLRHACDHFSSSTILCLCAAGIYPILAIKSRRRRSHKNQIPCDFLVDRFSSSHGSLTLLSFKTAMICLIPSTNQIDCFHAFDEPFSSCSEAKERSCT
jgi:hypothetical protein